MTMSTPDDATAALRRLITASLDTHEALAARVGLNPTDLRCLVIAAGEPDVTPSRLAELSRLTSGAVTGVLDRLERAGFARREADPEDRRRLMVRVDPEQLTALEAEYTPIVERAIGAAADAVPAVGTEAGRYLTAIGDVLAREADRLHVSTHGGILDDAYLVPRGDVARARLVLHTGAPRLSLGRSALGQQVRMVAETAATRLTVVAAEPGEELIRASFVGPPPDVRTSEGTVTMRYRRRLIDPRSRAISAQLHPAAAWALQIEDGITDIDADLSGLTFTGLAVRGGANHFRLRLPKPSGTVRIRIEGGVSEGTVTRPAGVPVLVSADEGASRLSLDDERRESSGTELRVRSRTYDRGPDRYEIEIGGGISELNVSEE